MRSSKTRRTATRVVAPLVLTAFAAPLTMMIAAPAAAQSTGCLDTNCFYDRQVRDFTVLDSDTAIIYIGHERCPYLIEVNGHYCDMKYIPDIEFYSQIQRRRDVATGQRDIRQRGFQIAGQDGFTTNDRVCTTNAFRYALETFGFGLLDEEEVPVGVDACAVRSIEKLTDDDLVEVYAEEGIAPPPPPIGNGTISRSGDDSQ